MRVHFAFLGVVWDASINQRARMENVIQKLKLEIYLFHGLDWLS